MVLECGDTRMVAVRTMAMLLTKGIANALRMSALHLERVNVCIVFLIALPVLGARMELPMGGIGSLVVFPRCFMRITRCVLKYADIRPAARRLPSLMMRLPWSLLVRQDSIMNTEIIAPQAKSGS